MSSRTASSRSLSRLVSRRRRLQLGNSRVRSGRRASAAAWSLTDRIATIQASARRRSCAAHRTCLGRCRAACDRREPSDAAGRGGAFARTPSDPMNLKTRSAARPTRVPEGHRVAIEALVIFISIHLSRLITSHIGPCQVRGKLGHPRFTCVSPRPDLCFNCFNRRRRDGKMKMTQLIQTGHALDVQPKHRGGTENAIRGT